MDGIGGSGPVEWEVEGVGVFAVKHTMAGGADADEVEVGIISTGATRDIVVQVNDALVGAEDAGASVAVVDGAARGSADFGFEHNVEPPLIIMRRAKPQAVKPATAKRRDSGLDGLWYCKR